MASSTGCSKDKGIVPDFTKYTLYLGTFKKCSKSSVLFKNNIFQSLGEIFCVEFQRYLLKFHTKYLTHTWKDMYFIHRWKFKSY